METDRTITPADESDEAPETEPIAEEMLIEEISIDGMCGVY